MVEIKDYFINKHINFIIMFGSLLVLYWFKIRKYEVQYYALLNLDRA